MNNLDAISVVDGRYAHQLDKIREIFTEKSLIKFRCYVEIKYFLLLIDTLPELYYITDKKDTIKNIYETLSDDDYLRVKEIEKEINHDVKAVEYFVKEKLKDIGIDDKSREFCHYCLTSNDINSVVYSLQIAKVIEECIKPFIGNTITELNNFKRKNEKQKMLGFTHGQPATPISIEHFVNIYNERLVNELNNLNKLFYKTKFSGATGGLNAHKFCHPHTQWELVLNNFINSFVINERCLVRNSYTTQIDHYDNHTAIFDNVSRICTIMTDLCWDFWSYISKGYFKLKINSKEVGSSTMPHKLNPIDFENAIANYGLGVCLLQYMSRKLPISREQRDLTDSSTLRNLGLIFSYVTIGFNSFLRGLKKTDINIEKLNEELNDNWVIVSENIQCYLKKIGYSGAYEKVKDFTRNNTNITKDSICEFIISLNLDSNHQEKLLNLSPNTC